MIAHLCFFIGLAFLALNTVTFLTMLFSGHEGDRGEAVGHVLCLGISVSWFIAAAVIHFI